MRYSGSPRTSVTTKRHIDVRGISVEVVRKDIKNLHVGVYPPNGRVRVAAPLRLGEDAVRLAVISRLGWIRRQQTGFFQQDRQSQRDLVTGESHHFQGRRYRLDVIEDDGTPRVRLRSGTRMQLRVQPGSPRQKRDSVLQQWYRKQLKRQVPQLLEKWERKIGVEVAEVRIKRMRTRWGSCTTAARRIWLNLELSKKPSSCLEYIFVHEMVHLLERQHNERFRDLMDRFMPTWRLHRETLNRAPLAHEDWQY